MPIKKKSILSLVETIKIDQFYVVCYFRCKIKNKTIVSTVPFEPYAGKIELTWSDIVFSPIKSYNRYYHTPITIYGDNAQETIVFKAFKNVSKQFRWDEKEQKYILK